MVSHKNVANVHLSDGELGLGALALASEVERKALLVASDVGKGCAAVVVGALGAEGHTASHLRVRPDFSFKRFDLENFILEEHFVLLNGLSDAHILAIESGHGPLLASFELRLGLCGVVGVI